MVSLDVLSGKADELFVIRSFQVMPAGAVNRAHGYLPFLVGLTVVKRGSGGPIRAIRVALFLCLLDFEHRKAPASLSN
jgi:hypothetical protein